MNTFTIPDLKSLDWQLQRIREIIKTGLDRGAVVVELRRESKNREMEKKYHAMINDIAKTVNLGQSYSVDAFKALLVDQYEQDLKSLGETLRHGSRVVISLDGQRAVTIRASTTKFLKAEGSGFIEFLYSWGAEHGAKFTDKSLSIYDEYKT